jgi:hypothetical protein
MFTNCATVDYGYRGSSWSRFDKHGESLPEVKFTGRLSKEEKSVSSADKVEHKVKCGARIEEYRKRLSVCFNKKNPDFEKAADLISDMLANFAEDSGADVVMYHYLSTLGEILAYAERGYKTENPITISKDSRDEIRRRLRKDLLLFHRIYPHYSSEDYLKLVLSAERVLYSFIDIKSKDFYDIYKKGPSGDTPFESMGGLYDFFTEYESQLPVYRSGEKVLVRAHAAGFDAEPEVGMVLYRVNPLELLKSGISLQNPRPLKNSKPLRKWKQKVKSATMFNDWEMEDFFDSFRPMVSLEPPPPPEYFDSLRGGEFDISLPVSKPGFYLVGIESEFRKIYTPVLISDLDLITKYDGDTLLGFCGNSKSVAEGCGELLFSIVEGKRVLRQFRDAGNGICAVRTKGTPVGGFVIAGKGGHYAFAEIKNPLPFKKQSNGFVYTDRPCYRPGDTVHIKVITRLSDPLSGTFTGINREDVDLNVRDSRGNIIKTYRLKPNEFGTVTADLTIPEEIKLGLCKITAKFADGSTSGDFNVQEYRKPECKIDVKFDKRSIVIGDSVKVHVHGEYYHGKVLKGRKGVLVVKEGSVVLCTPFQLDQKGNYTTTLKTSTPDYIKVTAEITDISGRVFSGKNSLPIYESEYTVAISSSSSYIDRNEMVDLVVQTRSYNYTDISCEVILDLVRVYEKNGKKVTEKIFSGKKMKSDKKGILKFPFRGLKHGKYKFTASVSDEKGRFSADSETINVSESLYVKPEKGDKSNRSAVPHDIITIQRRDYTPSEKMDIKVGGSRDSGRVLVTMDTGKILSFSVLPINTEKKISLPEKSSISHLDIRSYSFLKGRLNSGFEKVDMKGNNLNVDISASKSVYEPGDRVDVTLKSTTWNGKGAESEFSMSVVDKSIMDMKHSRRDLNSLFRRINYRIPVESAFKVRYNIVLLRRLGFGSWSGLYGCGTSYCVSKGAAVRRDFKDTAFWKGDLYSDAGGKWDGHFQLPDDLTTWVMRAVAVTKDGKAGEGKCEIRTSKDFMVRLITPRTFTEKDIAVVSAVIDNYSSVDKKCIVQFNSEGAGLLKGKVTQSVKVPSKSSVVVNWKIGVESLNPVSFTVFAKSGDDGDGEERSVPVVPIGVENRVALGNLVEKRAELKFSIPDDVEPESLRFNLNIKPMPLVASILSSVDYLVDYPYGCVEQTMSRFMPALSAKSVLVNLKKRDLRLEEKIEKCVSQSLYKLYCYQHKDGGWGWWKTDATNTFLTAYVMYGFGVTKDAGYEVEKKIIDRGIKCLEKLIPEEEDLQMKAFMVMALSLWARPEKVWVDELYRKRETIGNFGLGALLFICSKLDEKLYISEILKIVEKRSEDDSGSKFWSSRGMKLTAGTVQSTAFMLKALLTADPESKMILKAVNFLMIHQKGGRWSSTKESAAAVEALSLYLGGKNRECSKCSGSFTVNGGEVHKFSLGDDLCSVNLMKCGIEKLKKGENLINIDLKSTKPFAYSGEVLFRSRGFSTRKYSNGLDITREYFRLSLNPDGSIKSTPISSGDSVHQGDSVKVKLKVKSKFRGAGYLMLRDPIPAGFEVLKERTKNSNNYTQIEYRDAETIFFITSIPDDGVILEYSMRAETPGLFSANPADAELMYHPEIFGHSELFKVNIEKKPAE